MPQQPKRYRLITGQFYLRFEERAQPEQPQPDGDTMRFVPDNPFPFFNPSTIRRYGSVGPDLSNFGISVRFEGLDALETHFSKGGSPVTHQNLALAMAARDAMIGSLGFGNVVFDAEYPYTVRSADNNPVRGYVLANGVEQNGRLLGFVYPGEPVGVPEYDKWKQAQQGAPQPASRPSLPPTPLVFLDAPLVERSVNWKLLDAGLAYAELYTSMPLDLVRQMARRVRHLRAEPPANGIWGREHVALGRSYVWDKQIDSLEDLVMFPKLFRRLVEYAQALSTAKSPGKLTFMSWLRDPISARERDDRLLLPPAAGNTDPPSCEFGNLHDLVELHGKEAVGRLELSLKYNPEDVIVLPDNV